MRRRLAWLAVATLCSGSVQAIGLRPAVGGLVIGRPLRITIPLESEDAKPVDAACFRLQPPALVTEPEYVLRDAYLQVDMAGGKPQLLIVSRRAWIHPVVEFRVAAVCSGMDVVRDYTLLVDMPVEHSNAARQPGGVDAAVVVQQEVRRASPPTPASAAPAEVSSLTLDAPTDLNTLARQRYPEDRAARDLFRKMLQDTNPELFGGKTQIGSIPLAAGTVLHIPRNLPPPTTAMATPAAAPVPVPRPVKKEEKPAAPPKPDRLVIGGNPGSVPKPGSELAATIERLERMSEDQGRTTVRISDNLDALEQAMTALAKNLLQMEDRMQKLSEERDKAEEARLAALAKLAEERSKFGFLEMLVLILTSGGVGAGLLFYYDRLRSRRQQEVADFRPVAASSVAIPTPPPAHPVPPASVETVSLEGTPFANLADEALDNSRFADFVATAHARDIPSPAVAVARPASRPVVDQPVVTERVEKVVAPPEVLVRTAVPEPLPEESVEDVPAAGNVIEFSYSQEAGTPPVVADVPPVEAGLRLPELDIHFDPIAPEETAVPAGIPAVEPLVIELDLSEPPALPQMVDAPDVFELEDLKRVAPDVRVAASVPATQPAASNAEVAMELADIMASMGLSKGAAEVLAEVIEENPNDATKLWLRFLDFYHKEDLHAEMADAFNVLKGNFNVDASNWDDATANAASLLDYRHIVESLVKLWKTEDCDAYLMLLLADTRSGTRAGFPRSVIEEILLLQRIFRERSML